MGTAAASGLAAAAALHPAKAYGSTYGQAPASVGDYIALMKPRVMSLVVFTALVGMMLAPQSLDHPVNPVLAAIALLALAVGAGASAALNMWYDSDIDAGMARTKNRPIPQGRISREDALAFGGALSLFSVMVMSFAANLTAAALLAFTIGFYVFVYTMWLKRRTAQNIVIGGAAGALPPLVGWAAVSGHLTLEPLVLFLIIFLWTPPHFWALALYREGDYAKVGVPMMPVVAGARSTCAQIVFYTVLVFAASLLPLALHMAGTLYAALALPAGLAFIALALRLQKSLGQAALFERRARQLFGFSLLYLTLLFGALLAEHSLMGIG
jgi:protoheme IX farnesyltransferase